MKHSYSILVAILISIILISQMACNKGDGTPEPAEYLEVNFPGLDHKHELYFHLDHDCRAIELLFNKNIDEESVIDNISLTDQNGSLDMHYDFEIAGNLVMIRFHKDFILNDAWKYYLTVSTSLHSIDGYRLKQNKTFDIRTSAQHIFKTTAGKTRANSRNTIACISDIHMGDSRANEDGYSWFGENKDALEDFLDTIAQSKNIKSLVIMGDLFDEWVVPYDVAPFDPEAGISNSKEYFEAIANASTNTGVIQRLQSIASNPDIDLVYIPGNHDMLMTQDILSDIIPDIIWAGDVSGLGIYNPIPNIVMEHGHRYDFFNTPQPLVNAGHMLPPGYFISRLDAQGMVSGHPETFKQAQSTEGSFEFSAAWTIAFLYVIHQFNMDIPPLDSANILMGGIDNYNTALSFNGAQDMYKADIEDLWPVTQTTNNVAVPISVFSAIWNGHFLTNAVTEEYIQQSPDMQEYKVIAFGHSHDPLINVYPAGKDYTQIYANTGSWVNAELCENDVRTFVIIKPGEWSGSEIDCVQLYQYNTTIAGKSNGFDARLISEENIETDSPPKSQ